MVGNLAPEGQQCGFESHFRQSIAFACDLSDGNIYDIYIYLSIISYYFMIGTIVTCIVLLSYIVWLYSVVELRHHANYTISNN